MGGKQTTVDAPIENVEQIQTTYKYHPYKVRGFARASKSGKALNILIKEEDGNHLLTISKLDIIDTFQYGTKCCVIEYQLSDEEKKELKNNGSQIF